MCVCVCVFIKRQEFLFSQFDVLSPSQEWDLCIYEEQEPLGMESSSNTWAPRFSTALCWVVLVTFVVRVMVKWLGLLGGQVLGVFIKKLWFSLQFLLLFKSHDLCLCFCIALVLSFLPSTASQFPPSLEVSCPVDFQWAVAFLLHDSIKHTLLLSVYCKYSCRSQLKNRKY